VTYNQSWGVARGVSLSIRSKEEKKKNAPLLARLHVPRGPSAAACSQCQWDVEKALFFFLESGWDRYIGTRGFCFVWESLLTHPLSTCLLPSPLPPSRDETRGLSLIPLGFRRSSLTDVKHPETRIYIYMHRSEQTWRKFSLLFSLRCWLQQLRGGETRREITRRAWCIRITFIHCRRPGLNAGHKSPKSKLLSRGILLLSRLCKFVVIFFTLQVCVVRSSFHNFSNNSWHPFFWRAVNSTATSSLRYSIGDKDPWGQVSSVPTTCLCPLLYATPKPRYQAYCNFHASFIWCVVNLVEPLESIMRWTSCPQWSSTVVPAWCWSWSHCYC
jgi:hypothetical protein